MKLNKKQEKLIEVLLKGTRIKLTESKYNELVEENKIEGLNEFDIERVGRELLYIDVFHLESSEVIQDVSINDLIL